jgi:hypothetical protein
MLYVHARPPLLLVLYICITKQRTHGSLDSTNWTCPPTSHTARWSDRERGRERKREREIPLGIHLHKHTCDVLILSANQVNSINRQTCSRCLRCVPTFILWTKNYMMRWDQYGRKMLRIEKLCRVEYKMTSINLLWFLCLTLSFCRRSF